MDDAKRGFDNLVPGRTQDADTAMAEIQKRRKAFAKKSSTAK
jgi:hypothetical protein